jgi:hypothetical protein
MEYNVGKDLLLVFVVLPVPKRDHVLIVIPFPPRNILRQTQQMSVTCLKLILTSCVCLLVVMLVKVTMNQRACLGISINS